MWKNIVEPDRPQITIWCMRITCWIPKATNPHSEYEILIGFSQEQWLHESFSVLCHTYSVGLVIICILSSNKNVSTLYDNIMSS